MTDQDVTDIRIFPHFYKLGSTSRSGFPNRLFEVLLMSDFEHGNYAADL